MLSMAIYDYVCYFDFINDTLSFISTENFYGTNDYQ